MENYILISDAAKEVKVESHVLRYWEEELHLPIKRNELGHRYYTKEDVERFKQIKTMKERGLQLKAIKMILKDGKIDVMLPEDEKEAIKRREEGQERAQAEAVQEKERLEQQEKSALDTDNTEWISHNPEININEKYVKESEEKGKGMAINIVDKKDTTVAQESREDKARRLQWLLQQLIRETLQENNKELCRDIKESIVKELDYQFRARDERDEERDRIQNQRNEEYYQKMDELLRKKSRLKKSPQVKKQKEKEPISLKERIQKDKAAQNGFDFCSLDSKKKESAEEKEKRKRHSIF